jgi:hypothetical protein
VSRVEPSVVQMAPLVRPPDPDHRPLFGSFIDG